MNSFNYLELIQQSEKFTPLELAKNLGFKESLRCAQKMLVNEEWDESLQEYATKLLEEVQKIYSADWSSNWKYDAFLGYAYDIVLKYDERYASYKKAFDKATPAPPELLVALASCCWAPGKPNITEEDAILLVKQAITPVKYIEAIELLKGLYKSIGNTEEERYWEKVLEDIKSTGPHLRPLDQI